ncbi:hypothetical protein ACJZ2D_007067 [Fusarium nematophilum]
MRQPAYPISEAVAIAMGKMIDGSSARLDGTAWAWPFETPRMALEWTVVRAASSPGCCHSCSVADTVLAATTTIPTVRGTHVAPDPPAATAADG